MKRILSLIAMILFAAAGAAQAQVAAPSLIPFEFATVNPAAMQWGAPSRVGTSYGKITLKPNGSADVNSKFTQSGARWVWEAVSVAVNFDTLQTQAASTETISTTVGTALALPWARHSPWAQRE